MAKSSIVIDLDDPRSERIAEVMSNKSAKRILALLAEGEMSSSEIAEKLGAPLNTVTYNVSKLVEAGLVEKVDKMFWSSKGKRMEIYKVSNRRIVISPKKIVRGILPALIVSLIVTFAIALVQMQGVQVNEQATSGADSALKVTAPSAAEAGASLAQGTFEENADVKEDKSFAQTLQNSPDSWAWYLIGALTALVVILIWSAWRR